MSDSFVFNMPVELSLEFMAPVCANGMDPERKLLDKVINDITCVRLVVPGINFESAYPRCINDISTL